MAPTYGIARGTRRVVRGEVRLGAPELVRIRTPRRGDEALRPRGWAGEHWSPAIGAEALATRGAAGLFDETSFAKLEIVGPGAVAFLQSMCGNDVDVPVGRIVYTQLLNRRGGIECDVTVTRVTTDRYLFITGTAYGQHDMSWLRRHLPDDGSVVINDITSGRVCFALWGPRARDILAPLTRDDVSDAGFPYLTARAITIGSVPVYALRVTYVGELGWELYAHTEFGQSLWRTLWEAGRPHGMVAGGYRAIDALRLEKGYRVWSSDITPDETPFEAGLGFAVALDKEPEFIGRDALVAAKAAGPRKRLRCLVLDDARSVCLGNEPVRVGGEVVGRVTSGGYGFAVERSIAYAYLPPDRAAIGTRGEVEVFGDWIGFEVVARAAVRPGRREDPGVTRSGGGLRCRTGRPGSGAARTPSCAAGWTSRWPPATRRTWWPGGISGATSRSRPSPTSRS